MSVIDFFFNDTATTEIYTLSLHDALPIWSGRPGRARLRRRDHPGADRPQARVRDLPGPPAALARGRPRDLQADRKSTRLNSSHANISYAVFCLKKKYHHLVLPIVLSPSTA